jgi:hypothetical protein
MIGSSLSQIRDGLSGGSVKCLLSLEGLNEGGRLGKSHPKTAPLQNAAIAAVSEFPALHRTPAKIRYTSLRFYLVAELYLKNYLCRTETGENDYRAAIDKEFDLDGVPHSTIAENTKSLVRMYADKMGHEDKDVENWARKLRWILKGSSRSLSPEL